MQHRRKVLLVGRGDLVCLGLQQSYLDLLIAELKQLNFQPSRRQVLHALHDLKQPLVRVNPGTRNNLPWAPGPVIIQFLPLQLHSRKNRLGQAGVGILFLGVLNKDLLEPLVQSGHVELRFDRHEIKVVGLVVALIVRGLRRNNDGRHVGHRSDMLDVHVGDLADTRKTIDTAARTTRAGDHRIGRQTHRSNVNTRDGRIKHGNVIIDLGLVRRQVLGWLVELLLQEPGLRIDLLVDGGGADVLAVKGNYVGTEDDACNQEPCTQCSDNNQDHLLNIFFEKAAYFTEIW